MSHTPGPVTARVMPYRATISAGDDDNVLAEVIEGNRGKERQAANTRLLAAAYNSYTANAADPVAAAEDNLLGHAIAALELVEAGAPFINGPDRESVWKEILAAARAVLAKAHSEAKGAEK